MPLMTLHKAELAAALEPPEPVKDGVKQV